jgi:FkbM family methyltransferase
MKHRLREFLAYFVDLYALKSYSQEGEDMILRRIFEPQRTGFYVDVGAHHPRRFSNTYFFYRRGWSGINLDPMPGSMKGFRRQRPRDINLEIAVGSASRRSPYFLFNEPALNGFDPEIARLRDASPGRYKIVQRLELTARPLGAILDEFLPAGTSIDFLNVDVEGLELEVLRSNDWGRYRPRVLLVEAVGSTWSPLHAFLTGHGYVLYAKTVRTLIYLSDPKAAQAGLDFFLAPAADQSSPDRPVPPTTGCES